MDGDFRKYAKFYYDFLDVTERRAIALAETAQVASAWRVSFALQRAFKERQVLRVEFLLSRHEQSYFSGNSLENISARVDGGWSDTEERALVESLGRYSKVRDMISDL